LDLLLDLVHNAVNKNLQCADSWCP